MTNNYYPLKHPFIRLTPKTNKVDASLKTILDDSYNCAWIEVPIFGKVVTFTFNFFAEECMFFFDDETYYFDNFLVGYIGQPDQYKLLDARIGPNIVIADLYHCEDSAKRVALSYVHNDLPQFPGKKTIDERLMLETLSKSREKYPKQNHCEFGEWDFPLFATMMAQRVLGIDPRI